VEIATDPADGQPAIVTGAWTLEKHRLLKHYVDISHKARLGWVDPAEAKRRKLKHGPQGAAYIELFCGPGRICLRDTGRFENGSPLVAYDEAARTRTAFTEMHLGDEQKDFNDALQARLQARGVNPTMYSRKAEVAATEIVGRLKPYGLNFAFLDPFGFEGLPFSIIETLGKFKRMDVLIYVSAEGLQRMLPIWVPNPNTRCPLDDFAPGWRKAVHGIDPSSIVARGKVFEHYLSLIRKVGFLDPDKNPPLIRGDGNQPLYWLVLIAKHDLATNFWKKISKSPNGDLFSGC
jgi:three-Cys-motif partner protein